MRLRHLQLIRNEFPSFFVAPNVIQLGLSLFFLSGTVWKNCFPLLKIGPREEKKDLLPRLPPRTVNILPLEGFQPHSLKQGHFPTL